MVNRFDRFVYVLRSLDEETFMVFGTECRAEQFIKTFEGSIDKKLMFPKSSADSLYISKRTVF